MGHIFNGDFSKLESDGRKKTLPADEILKTINLRKGDILIDFGCGIGYFSIPATNHVGGVGKVIAIDISDRMIEEMKRRTIGMDNIEIVKSDNLKGFKGDVILIVTVLHEVDDPKAFLDQCISSLNPKGKLVIIDWQKKETGMGPPKEHRIAKESVIKMVDKEFIEHPINDSFYFLEFRI